MSEDIGTPIVEPTGTTTPAPAQPPLLVARQVSLTIDGVERLTQIDLDVPPSGVVALMGAPGSGPNLVLRCLNRLIDEVPRAKVTGLVSLRGTDIRGGALDAEALRARVGFVFDSPNPFPTSIFDNVAYGARIHGLARNRAELAELVESSLTRVGLWGALSERLKERATTLNVGEQQLLCLARALATQPEILLMDAPCQALDEGASAKVEEAIAGLKTSLALVVATSMPDEARRVSDHVAYFHSGTLVEAGPTTELFEAPRDERTRRFITGRLG